MFKREGMNADTCFRLLDAALTNIVSSIRAGAWRTLKCPTTSPNYILGKSMLYLADLLIFPKLYFQTVNVPLALPDGRCLVAID